MLAREVLRKAGLDRGFSTVLDHEASNFAITGEDLFVRKGKHRAAAALAGFNLELALGSGFDDEVLQQTVCSNARSEFGICSRIAVTTDITGRLNELVQRNRFDHGTHS